MPDIAAWIEALASCAIEGNPWAEEMLALYSTNPKEFLRRLAVISAAEAWAKEAQRG